MPFRQAFRQAGGPMADLVAHVLVFVLGALAIWLLDLGLGLAFQHLEPYSPNQLLVYVGDGFEDILLVSDVVLFVCLLWVSFVRTIKEISKGDKP